MVLKHKICMFTPMYIYMIIAKCEEIFAFVRYGFSSQLCEFKYAMMFACYLVNLWPILYTSALMAVGGFKIIFRIRTLWGFHILM